MSSIVISGDTSGAITLSAPAVSGTNTLTLPAQTATIATLTTPSFTSTIGVGGATPSASGSGVSFPATQSASSDANTLDDYEEGTWTPTYTNITGSPTGIARYTKIGRQVTLTYEQTGGTFTCTSAAGSITGIPFLGIGGTSRTSACGAISDTQVTSVLALYSASTAANLYITASFVSASGVGFSITYFTT
jgi:hypothetical protein